MSYFPHGAFVAIHAANEQRRRDEEEELLMTRYSIDELDSDWEFKIVRSDTNAFRRQDVFATLLQEESLAGWELVEKLDDRRVRFKRRRDARRRDATLPQGVDPYRSHYGKNPAARTFVVIGVAMMLALGVGFAVLFSANYGTEAAADPIPWIAISIGGVFVLLIGIAVVAIRRSR